MVCTNCSVAANTAAMCFCCGDPFCANCVRACQGAGCDRAFCKDDGKFVVACEACSFSYCLQCFVSLPNAQCQRCEAPQRKERMQAAHRRLIAIEQALSGDDGKDEDLSAMVRSGREAAESSIGHDIGGGGAFPVIEPAPAAPASTAPAPAPASQPAAAAATANGAAPGVAETPAVAPMPPAAATLGSAANGTNAAATAAAAVAAAGIVNYASSASIASAAPPEGVRLRAANVVVPPPTVAVLQPSPADAVAAITAAAAAARADSAAKQAAPGAASGAADSAAAPKSVPRANDRVKGEPRTMERQVTPLATSVSRTQDVAEMRESVGAEIAAAEAAAAAAAAKLEAEEEAAAAAAEAKKKKKKKKKKKGGKASDDDAAAEDNNASAAPAAPKPIEPAAPAAEDPAHSDPEVQGFVREVLEGRIVDLVEVMDVFRGRMDDGLISAVHESLGDFAQSVPQLCEMVGLAVPSARTVPPRAAGAAAAAAAPGGASSRLAQPPQPRQGGGAVNGYGDAAGGGYGNAAGGGGYYDAEEGDEDEEEMSDAAGATAGSAGGALKALSELEARVRDAAWRDDSGELERLLEETKGAAGFAQLRKAARKHLKRIREKEALAAAARQQERAAAARRPDPVPLVDPACPYGPPPRPTDTFHKMVIPPDVIGWIIGKNGSHINEIKKRSGAEMECVGLDGNRNGRHELQLSGPPIAVRKAFEEIVTTANRAPVMRAALAVVNHSMPCPQSLVAHVIGKAGHTIIKMQEESGANISVDQSGPPEADKTINIKGTRFQVAAAEELIRRLMGALPEVAGGGPAAAAAFGGAAGAAGYPPAAAAAAAPVAAAGGGGGGAAVSSVEGLMASLGFPQYGPEFVRHGFELDDVLKCNAEDLEDLEIPPEDCRRLLAAFAAHNGAAAAAAAPAPANVNAVAQAMDGLQLESECYICMEREKTSLLLPCRHRLCEPCATPYLNQPCPKCDELVEEVLHGLFL